METTGCPLLQAPMVLCDVCAFGEAVVYCSADQANLCAGCDRDVHSANAMSARHVREPLQVGLPAQRGPPPWQTAETALL